MRAFLKKIWADSKRARDIFGVEAAAYSSQVAVFFLVAVLMSNLVQDEKVLAEMVHCRLGPTFLREIVCTIIGSSSWLGALLITSRCLPSTAWAKVINQVLYELPRTIYFFGSSVAGLMLATAVAEAFHPKQRNLAYLFSGIAFSWALALFAYGFVLKVMLEAGEDKDRWPGTPEADKTLR